MKRVNIYITEKEETALDYLSEILDCKSRSEIVRKAIDEYSHKYESEIKEFSAGLIEDLSNVFLERQSTFIDECEKDPTFFIENAIKIMSPDVGSIPFTLYPHQSELIHDIDLYNELIINKSRQSGVTNSICAYIVNYLLRNKHKNVVVVSARQSDATEIIRIIKFMLTNLPESMKLEEDLSLNNKIRIEYNTNRVYGGIMNHESSHGINVDFLYMDEISRVKRESFDNFFASVIPTIVSRKNYKMIITSTPRGYDHFYKMWADALSNYNTLRPIAIPWTKVPNRDDAWKNQIISTIGKDRFEEEFNCQFVNRTVYAV